MPTIEDKTLVVEVLGIKYKQLYTPKIDLTTKVFKLQRQDAFTIEIERKIRLESSNSNQKSLQSISSTRLLLQNSKIYILDILELKIDIIRQYYNNLSVGYDGSTKI